MCPSDKARENYSTTDGEHANSKIRKSSRVWKYPGLRFFPELLLHVQQPLPDVPVGDAHGLFRAESDAVVAQKAGLADDWIGIQGDGAGRALIPAGDALGAAFLIQGIARVMLFHLVDVDAPGKGLDCFRLIVQVPGGNAGQGPGSQAVQGLPH
mgnify:CR=1 FL=1